MTNRLRQKIFNLFLLDETLSELDEEYKVTDQIQSKKREVLRLDESPSTLVEELAAIAHESWCSWTEYFFSKGEMEAGWLIIPQELVERWRRQMETPYDQLSEEEKESDRFEARKYLAAISNYLR